MEVSELLKELMDLQLDGELVDKETAISHAKQFLSLNGIDNR